MSILFNTARSLLIPMSCAIACMQGSTEQRGVHSFVVMQLEIIISETINVIKAGIFNIRPLIVIHKKEDLRSQSSSSLWTVNYWGTTTYHTDNELPGAFELIIRIIEFYLYTILHRFLQRYLIMNC